MTEPRSYETIWVRTFTARRAQDLAIESYPGCNAHVLGVFVDGTWHCAALEPSMPEQDLALLRTLAIRPVRTIASSLEPIVIALQSAGYVTYSPDGWIATAKGCELIEQKRRAAYPQLLKCPVATL